MTETGDERDQRAQDDLIAAQWLLRLQETNLRDQARRWFPTPVRVRRRCPLILPTVPPASAGLDSLVMLDAESF